MTRFWMWMIAVIVIILTVNGAAAAPGGVFTDPCYQSSHVDFGGLTQDLTITNNCTDASVQWDNDLNLVVLGDVVDGEVILGHTWAYVNSVLRPDLDDPATIMFTKPHFVTIPNVLRDGTTCSGCNVTQTNGYLKVTVPGFSNYTLTMRQDFTVYSDQEPELKAKVYQTVDLGDGRRVGEYACIVQVFGKNDQDDWVLVQTNPERKIQARMFGSPDLNQPESLGYFPTMNGIANTYFRNDNLYGYMDFNLVVQCTSNFSSKLVYEEPIMTTYSPAGRLPVSRGAWLSQGANAYYIVFWAGVALLLVWLIQGLRRLK
jgi:hypothetical protein